MTIKTQELMVSYTPEAIRAYYEGSDREVEVAKLSNATLGHAAWRVLHERDDWYERRCLTVSEIVETAIANPVTETLRDDLLDTLSLAYGDWYHDKNTHKATMMSVLVDALVEWIRILHTQQRMPISDLADLLDTE